MENNCYHLTHVCGRCSSSSNRSQAVKSGSNSNLAQALNLLSNSRPASVSELWPILFFNMGRLLILEFWDTKALYKWNAKWGHLKHLTSWLYPGCSFKCCKGHVDPVVHSVSFIILECVFALCFIVYLYFEDKMSYEVSVLHHSVNLIYLLLQTVTNVLFYLQV